MLVVPSDSSLAGVEQVLANRIGRETILREALDVWEEQDGGDHELDFVLFDCPPSLGVLSANVLVAAGSRRDSDAGGVLVVAGHGQAARGHPARAEAPQPGPRHRVRAALHGRWSHEPECRGAARDQRALRPAARDDAYPQQRQARRGAELRSHDLRARPREQRRGRLRRIRRRVPAHGGAGPAAAGDTGRGGPPGRGRGRERGRHRGTSRERRARGLRGPARAHRRDRGRGRSPQSRLPGPSRASPTARLSRVRTPSRTRRPTRGLRQQRRPSAKPTPEARSRRAATPVGRRRQPIPGTV